MKYLVKFFVVTFFLFISTHAFAEQKIVVLDMTYLLNQSTAGKGAQDHLKKAFDSNLKKFAEIEKSLKKEETDLLTKKNVLSNEEYAKKINSLRKKNMDYQTDRRTAIDKITAQRSKAREELLKKIKPMLLNYIDENNVSLIIDKKYILGGGPKNDITKIIVEKLNKELPSLNLK